MEIILSSKTLYSENQIMNRLKKSKLNVKLNVNI